jgi:phosphinothricin acetyltransferase
MWARVREVLKDYPWLVFEKNNKVIGYAYASKWKARSAYRFSAESTIYLHHNYIGIGVGTMLYQALIEDVKKRDVHRLIAGIALPNEPSIALHERQGFTKCAQFNEVGFKQNRWIDVGYWEKHL